MIGFIARAVRNTVFLLWFSALLIGTTISAGVWAVTATVQASAATAQLASATAAHRRQLATSLRRLGDRHRQQLATVTAAHRRQLSAAAAAHRERLGRAVMRAKAKARLRRSVVAIPFAGVAAVAAFEEMDYREWLEENPGGSRSDYGCEVLDATQDVLDEFMADLEPALQSVPGAFRPTRETVVGLLPECDRGVYGPTLPE